MKYKQPKITVDIIIEVGHKIVLIDRKNPPYGWALPGGFVEYGESLEHAVFRESEEETNLKIGYIKQFRTYSDPKRDIRYHTITTVFVAPRAYDSEKKAWEIMKAKDDAIGIDLWEEDCLPEDIAFDHREILRDYFKSKGVKND
jgi:ADP-ribose pyrophosphatase YjhB (NUDIX family)